jgi:hypothetical protein
LLQDAVLRARCEVIAWLARNSDATGLACVLELTVTPTGRYEMPTILLQQAEEFAHPRRRRIAGQYSSDGLPLTEQGGDNQATFPGLQLTDIFTEEGAKAIDAIVSSKCMNVAADTMSYAYGGEYRNLVRPKATNPIAWVEAFVRGSVPPATPVADGCTAEN